MLDAIKFVPTGRHRSAVLAVLLFAVVTVLLSTSAFAQCANWDAGGKWSIKQKGSPYTNDLTVVQKGKVITGTALTLRDTKGGIFIPGGRDTVGGTVDGTIDGDSFRIQIFWSNNLTGVYEGKVLPSGRLDGEAWEKASPNSRQTWYSVGVLKCLPPPPVIPKPIKSSGKAKPTLPPAPPKPPYITASPAIITAPTLPFASVYLGWDGGPDHPNVEVWVSINNGPEIPAFSTNFPPQHPIFKQPKVGGVEMKLPRNSGQYKYVLKAAGKTLSSTVVVYVS